MNDKTHELIDKMRDLCDKAGLQLAMFLTGNKSAGRRARKLLDQIAKDKVALRKAMIHADRNP